MLQERGEAIPAELATIHRTLLAKLRDAIKDVPLKHAGGTNPIFKHDGKDGGINRVLDEVRREEARAFLDRIASLLGV